MSNKPNPVALTAAMLMNRKRDLFGGIDGHHRVEEIAGIASDLHRLAPACERIAVGQCNHGYWCDAQSIVNEVEMSEGYKPDAQTLYCVGVIRRMDKKLAKLNERLAPLALVAKNGGDPRGWSLWLETTDKARPVNGRASGSWDGERWGIG